MRRLRLVLIISETGIWSPIKAVIYNVAAGRELEPVKSKQAHLQWHHWHVHYSNWSRQMARMVINQTPSLSILSPYWLCISVYQSIRDHYIIMNIIPTLDILIRENQLDRSLTWRWMVFYEGSLYEAQWFIIQFTPLPACLRWIF